MRKLAIAALAASPALALVATHLPQVVATAITWR